MLFIKFRVCLCVSPCNFSLAHPPYIFTHRRSQASVITLQNIRTAEATLTHLTNKRARILAVRVEMGVEGGQLLEDSWAEEALALV